MELKAYSKLIIIGLLFCLFGDIILFFNSYFLYGLVAFLLGHFCFLFAFVNHEGFHWPLKPGFFLGGFASLLIYLCYPKLNNLLIPVLIYIGVILLMSWQGISMQQRKQHSNFQFLGWAVGLFLFSDTLIALNKFFISFKWSNILILITYWISISLFATSAIKRK